MSVWNSVKSWFSRQSLAEPPELPIYWTLQSIYLARAYYVVAELRIADQLQAQPMTCRELAAANDCDERALFRVLRPLAAFGVFSENERGQFEMTQRSGGLLSHVFGSVRDWTVLTGSFHPGRPLDKRWKSSVQDAVDSHWLTARTWICGNTVTVILNSARPSFVRKVAGPSGNGKSF